MSRKANSVNQTEWAGPMSLSRNATWTSRPLMSSNHLQCQSRGTSEQQGRQVRKVPVEEGSSTDGLYEGHDVICRNEPKY
jgi:hypothetical protein